jgi:hypothetical protein
MGIRFYTGNAGGTVWTLIKEWADDKTYPAVTRDKDGRFHLLYVDEVTKQLETIYSDENGVTWSTPAVVIDTNVEVGDVGITYNEDEGVDDGRLIAGYWKSETRKYAYSDDRGANWTIGDVD